MDIVNPILKIVLLLSLIFSSVPVGEAPTARIMVVGDIMMHKPITDSGYDEETGEYRFDSVFTLVRPIFAQADLVIGNLETPVAGEKKGYSGYPRFNAPKEILAALKDAGVDVLTTANNHSLDQSESGLVTTIHHLNEFGILHTGTFEDEQSKKQPLIITINQIKIGIIANTYGTNGIPLPKDKPYVVNLLDLETIKEDIHRLKENNVDYIMAMIHFGYEYHRLPSNEQKKWTQTLFDNGVDFVLGSHPHVVQTLEIYKGDENQSDRGVIFSMGNFLSNQRGNWKDYGMILDLSLEKEFSTNKIRIKNASVLPTYVSITSNNNESQYSVIPIIEGITISDQKIVSNGKDLVEHVFRNEQKK